MSAKMAAMVISQTVSDTFIEASTRELLAVCMVAKPKGYALD
jgi:hypothetical protein